MKSAPQQILLCQQHRSQRLTFVRNVVAVEIDAVVEQYFKIIGDVVAVAVGFTFIGDGVAVKIGTEIGFDVERVDYAVAVAVFAFIRHAVAVHVRAGALGYILIIGHAVVVAIVKQAVDREIEVEILSYNIPDHHVDSQVGIGVPAVPRDHQGCRCR